MRICVYGAGAIGGHMAMRFHNAGADVSILARGATLSSIASDGLRMKSGDKQFVAQLMIAAEPEELSKPDVVVVAVKSQGLAAIAGRLERLTRDGTPIVFALNGLPWWYRRILRAGAGAPPADQGSDEAVLSAILRTEQVIGCTVSSTNSVETAGNIVNEMPSPNRFVFGGPTAKHEALCRSLSELMTLGGATGVYSDDIAGEIWRKLQLNLITNSFGCLTGLDSHALLASPGLRPMAERMLLDAREIAGKCGIKLSYDPSTLDASRVPSHKTSMLQDMEKGNSLEYRAVFGAALDVADWYGLDTPSLRLVAALLRAKAENLGLYPVA